MSKSEFEKLIGKCVDGPTYDLYYKMWEASNILELKKFVKLLNIKAIPESSRLKKLRSQAKKEIPRLEKKLNSLKLKKKDLDQVIEYSKNLQLQSLEATRWERVKLIKEIKGTNLELIRWKQKIK